MVIWHSVGVSIAFCICAISRPNVCSVAVVPAGHYSISLLISSCKADDHRMAYDVLYNDSSKNIL